MQHSDGKCEGWAVIRAAGWGGGTCTTGTEGAVNECE